MLLRRPENADSNRCRSQRKRRSGRAMTYARDHLFERSAVEDRRTILESALKRGMGETTYSQIRQEFDRRLQTGEFRAAQASVRGPQITTSAMLRLERETVQLMQEGEQARV